ncbi:MAG: Lsr2 family protein, partial [Actinomycetota bacterium]|nr:Lsr2 family protein [Actinomycetota bacterium]
MAQKVQVLLVCDLHEGEVEGTETVSFGLDGSTYEIDTCSSHAASLRDAFAPFVGAARRAGRTPAGSG